MSFTDPMTFVTDERLSRDDMNALLRDNMNALKRPPTAIYVTRNHSADYDTNNTSFEDVDTTNMTLALTTTGNGNGGNAAVMVGFCGTVYSTSTITVYFRIMRDGAALNADDGLIVVNPSNNTRPAAFMFLDGSVAAGAHTYALQWKVSANTGLLMANAGTATRNCASIFFVREMS